MVDGIAGPAVRRALGPLGRWSLGSRVIGSGAAGWDVSAVQFLFAWHGFPSRTIDGGFGPRLEAAVAKFQRFADLPADGIVRPATIRALRLASPALPVALSSPLRGAPIGDAFGPRGNHFHPGLDFPAASGTPVRAARRGRVIFAGWDTGGYGNLVVLVHRSGVLTFYAHLTSIAVEVGQRRRSGAIVGRVGATGEATGPHLHFEARVRGAAVDPLPALPDGGAPGLCDPCPRVSGRGVRRQPHDRDRAR